MTPRELPRDVTRSRRPPGPGEAALRPAFGRFWPSSPWVRPPEEGTRREAGSNERRGLPGPEDVALFFEFPKALQGGSEAVSKRTRHPPTLRAGSEQLLPAGRRAFAEAPAAETREAPAEVGWAGPGRDRRTRARLACASRTRPSALSPPRACAKCAARFSRRI